MKMLMSAFVVVFLLITGVHAQAAIGCVPGDCCGGRSCGTPTPPRPPNCMPAKSPLFLKSNIGGSCSSVQVKDCSECASHSTACAQHYDKEGDADGFSCVYCQ
ncbi:MAG: hypothetical protein ACKOX6_02830 [Bdellovibrio sp.]